MYLYQKVEGIALLVVVPLLVAASLGKSCHDSQGKTESMPQTTTVSVPTASTVQNIGLIPPPFPAPADSTLLHFAGTGWLKFNADGNELSLMPCSDLSGATTITGRLQSYSGVHVRFASLSGSPAKLLAAYHGYLVTVMGDLRRTEPGVSPELIRIEVFPHHFDE